MEIRPASWCSTCAPHRWRSGSLDAFGAKLTRRRFPLGLIFRLLLNLPPAGTNLVYANPPPPALVSATAGIIRTELRWGPAGLHRGVPGKRQSAKIRICFPRSGSALYYSSAEVGSLLVKIHAASPSKTCLISAADPKYDKQRSSCRRAASDSLVCSLRLLIGGGLKQVFAGDRPAAPCSRKWPSSAPVSFSLLVEFIHLRRGNPLAPTSFRKEVVKSCVLETFHQGAQVTA